MKSLLMLALVACTTSSSSPPPTRPLMESNGLGDIPPCPDTPASLAPAEDADLAFCLDVTEGSQRYNCLPGGVFTAAIPLAQLFSIGPDPHQVIYHFGGPSWEATDSSAVVAKKTAGETVDQSAVQWLLLDVVSHFGPTEVASHGSADGALTPSLLAPITQIQRLSTRGGLPPATGCDAAHIGQEFDSQYGARYCFYRSAPNVPGDKRVRCGAATSK